MEPSQKEKLKADLTEYNRLEKELFDFKKKIKAFKNDQYVIQEYIIGVTLYVAYFY